MNEYTGLINDNNNNFLNEAVPHIISTVITQHMNGSYRSLFGIFFFFNLECFAVEW